MKGCFHCGEPVLVSGFEAVVDEQSRVFCCAGCRAVSQLIHGAGLGRYYELRDGPSGGPVDVARRYDDFDRDESIYCDRTGGIASATIFVEGMYCSACSWLVEAALGRQAGVRTVSVDPISRRVHVDWSADELRLSDVLGRLAEVGYTPRPLALDGSSVLPERGEQRQALKRLIVASIGMMQVMMFAIGLYAGDAQGIDAGMEYFLRLVSMIVATPVVIYAGRPFFDGAIRGLLALKPGMDLPVAIAIGLAYAGSVYSTFTHGAEVWFDSVTMFVFFLTLGRFIEMRARQRAVARSDSLRSLLPDTVQVIVEDRTETRAASAIRAGDRLLVRPGDHVAADGTIEAGSTSVDESVLTGESRPQPRSAGDELIAGSINLDGAVELRVSRSGSGTLLAGVERLSRSASRSKPAIVQSADRIASWFVSIILVLATVVAVVWSQLDPARAFVVTLSVLVVTCPCALALATPAALAAVSDRMSGLRLLLKNSNALESLSRCTHVVFDKTGTLTTGRPVLRDVELLDEELERDDALAIAAALEAHSAHPIAAAFLPFADGRRASASRNVAAQGLEAMVDGRAWRLGRRAFAGGPGSGDADDGRIAVYLGDGSALAARFTLTDELRVDAPETVNRLLQMGLNVSLLSGDSERAVAQAADALGIGHFASRQAPDDKLAAIRALQAQGERVLMVGDGINDAPVIAGADASIAPSTAADAAATHADIVLLGERLMPVVDAILLARRTIAIVKQNLGWAIAYNVAAVPMAAAGMVPTWLAALGMSASSLVVVLNALRLAR